MKLKASFPLAVSVLASILLPLNGAACGPEYRYIPVDDYFWHPETQEVHNNVKINENVRLWQRLTGPSVPEADIRAVVYDTAPVTPSNKFQQFLSQGTNSDIRTFIKLAKRLASDRSEVASPWYYPENRGNGEPSTEFDYVLEEARRYKGTRLADRYAYQVTRALFASHRYADCIAYVDSAFAPFPSTNLLKRMALEYVAGSWAHLGNPDKANLLFARSGDVLSITGTDPVKLMAQENPAAPELMAYIAERIGDKAYIRSILPSIRRIAADPRVSYKGDWNFTLAYIAGRYDRNIPLAKQLIYTAMNQPFSSPSLKALANEYRTKIDAQTHNAATLLPDLERHMAMQRSSEDILYNDWIPYYLDKKDYATALLLCAYADNYPSFSPLFHSVPCPVSQPSNMQVYRKLTSSWLHFNSPSPAEEQIHAAWDSIKSVYPSLYPSISELYDRNNPLSKALIGILAVNEPNSVPAEEDDSSSDFDTYYYTQIDHERPGFNPHNYSSLSFQMMGSLSSARLEEVLHQIQTSDTPLYKLLRPHMLANPDYYNELIGTLALREENYPRAVEFFSKVSNKYLRSMNIDRGGYLSRNPFYPYASRLDNETKWGAWDHATFRHTYKSNPRAKLDFAIAMRDYQREMTNGATPDTRAMAALKYAIGRRNSFQECWALTQYWRGDYVDLAETSTGYDTPVKAYNFFYNYDGGSDYSDTAGADAKAVEARYTRDVATALSRFGTPEGRAEALALLGRLPEVLTRYPDTPAANRIKTTCDNWQNWL